MEQQNPTEVSGEDGSNAEADPSPPPAAAGSQPVEMKSQTSWTGLGPTMLAVLSYMICSSTMLVANKLAIKLFPAPNLLLIVQLAFSAVFLWGFGFFGIFEVDALTWDKLRRYWVVAAVFLLNIYTNIMALKSMNVETVIVFRSVTTVVVAFFDFKTLRGEGLPSAAVMGSLFSIVLFAVAYVYSESNEGFNIANYGWVTAYVAAQSIDCLYIKHVVNTVKMTSWGRSYYNNLLAMGPLVIPWALSEKESMDHLNETGALAVPSLMAVFVSCLLGLCISVSAFHCRQMVSATSYSVIGNMNKVLTIIINCTIWSHHATAAGIFWLSCCLVAGYAYSQVKPKGMP